MSKLNNLLQDLCPNGVKYAKLGTVATISRGGNFQKKDFCEKGVPCIHYGQIYTRYGLFTDKTLSFISEETAKKQKYAVKNDIIMAVTSENIEDVCKCVAWLGEQKIAVSGHSAIIHHTINPKFLCYYFHTEMFASQKKKLAHGTKVIEVTPDKLSDIIIPLPPLPVQEEIVRILDNFTELEAELKAELEARKKQYEFYRDSLLKFDTGGGSRGVKWEQLQNISDIGTGSHNTNEELEKGSYPFFVRSQDVRRLNSFDYDEEAIITSGDGVGVGKIYHYVHGKYALHQRAYRIHINTPNVLPKFFYYYMKTTFLPYIEKNAFNSSVTSIRRPMLNSYPVPIIPIKEQERIVKILDRFDKLCNDLTEGLPAEIESRRKQYEYYRDKLLTFTPAQ